MLEEKDLQSIGKLLDERFKNQDGKLDKKFKENNKILKDEIVDEITVVVNDAFNESESNINKRVDGLENKIIALDKKVDLRPTLKHIMDWGDRKIVAVELDMDKIKYLHLKEFKNLPAQAEISQVLVEHDLKIKNTQHDTR